MNISCILAVVADETPNKAGRLISESVDVAKRIEKVLIYRVISRLYKPSYIYLSKYVLALVTHKYVYSQKTVDCLVQ